jgi:hypothetical protein
VNARVAHFVAGHSAECTVCNINDEPAPRQAETFLHVFFECHFTSRYKLMAETEFFPEISELSETEKKNVLATWDNTFQYRVHRQHVYPKRCFLHKLSNMENKTYKN